LHRAGDLLAAAQSSAQRRVAESKDRLFGIFAQPSSTSWTVIVQREVQPARQTARSSGSFRVATSSSFLDRVGLATGKTTEQSPFGHRQRKTPIARRLNGTATEVSRSPALR